MNRFLALLEHGLSDLRDSRISATPSRRAALSPVWAMPMMVSAEATADGFPALPGSRGSDPRTFHTPVSPIRRVTLAPVWATPMVVPAEEPVYGEQGTI